MPIEQPNVTVKVSRELLAQLNRWSVPVRVRIVRYGSEYTMEARKHVCSCGEGPSHGGR